MKKEVYYVKSLEEDLATKSLKGKNKVTCQTVADIIKTKIIQPNTKSFGRKQRLACTILDKNYTKTYRPHGIIFQTQEKPDYIVPFDIVLLSCTDDIVVHYYRIKDKLHIYYNHDLIKGFGKFIFKTFKGMIEKYPSPLAAWKEVNKFRKAHGYKNLKRQKYRLVEYNEVIFHKPIKIKPIAIYGYRKETRKHAKELNLPCFQSAKEFYKKMEREKRI